MLFWPFLYREIEMVTFYNDTVTQNYLNLNMMACQSSNVHQKVIFVEMFLIVEHFVRNGCFQRGSIQSILEEGVRVRAGSRAADS